MASIEEVCDELQRHFQDDGFDIKVDKAAADGGSISCDVESSMASDLRLQKQAIQLFTQTKELNRLYQQQKEKVEKTATGKWGPCNQPWDEKT